MSDDVVDVLIIGAGASGAAVAWSLAETRARVEASACRSALR
jgi:glycine/D-amino acid oxidase-like deaminating enzyme